MQKNSLCIKRSFPLTISSVNVTKSAGNCGFGHIYWRNRYRKTSFFVQWLFLIMVLKTYPKSDGFVTNLWKLLKQMLWMFLTSTSSALHEVYIRWRVFAKNKPNLIPRAILRILFRFSLIGKRCAGDEVERNHHRSLPGS